MVKHSPSHGDCISAADLRRLTHSVARRASGVLSQDDVEDIAGEILADAVAASRRTGIAVMKLAHAGAKRPRYYARARDRALTRRAEMASSSLGDDHDEVNDEPCGARGDMAENAALWDLINRLPPGLRQVFVRCSLDGATFEELSSSTGVPVSTLHRRLDVAKDVLQAMYFAADEA